MLKSDCVFCRIVAGTEDAELLATYNDALAIRPLNPVTLGHALVIPTTHVTDFTTDRIVSGAMMARASQYAQGNYHPSAVPAYNVITSAGADATQTVFHLHLHIVPRRPGDGLALPWSAEAKLPDSELIRVD